jgi:hypothetical protein
MILSGIIIMAVLLSYFCGYFYGRTTKLTEISMERDGEFLIARWDELDPNYSDISQWTCIISTTGLAYLYFRGQDVERSEDCPHKMLRSDKLRW